MRSATLRGPQRPLRPRERQGAILVLSAVLMVVMMAFVALSVDVGYMQNVQTELDRAVDASALAGAGVLPEGAAAADMAARDFMLLNPVGNQPLVGDELTIQAGHWDEVSRRFTPDNQLPSAFRVIAQRQDQRPLFFAHVFGEESFDLQASAVATFQPRDIMVVLDYSASMNDDSEFKTIDTLGNAEVEANQLQIYGELGSPSFGAGLAWEPQWMTIPGNEPTNSYRPKIHVQHRYNQVYVTSTKPFSRVRVYRYGNYTTSYAEGTWNADEQVYEQHLTYNDSSRITRVKVRSGHWDSNQQDWNRYEENFWTESTSQVRSAARKAWGLNSTSYPYPGGSWNEYIDYCTSSQSSNQNKQAGYRYQFGYRNFVNYLLNWRPSHASTPLLANTSEQPITAVKNSVDVFLGFMQEINTSDRVGLAIYNSSSGWGKLEQELTLNYGVLSSISRQRQAGHYHSMTNIAAGLDEARQELQSRGRAGALKMIVLMTDGVPTFPQSTSYARQLAINAAQECANAKFPVVTISLGTGADVALMEQIAQMTGGIHFNVQGGRPVAEVEEDLRETFRQIAKERPLRLVAAGRGQ